MLKNPIAKILLLSLLTLPLLAGAVELRFTEVAPGVHAFIGEMGGRSYQNEGMNANVGFVVTKDGVVVIDSGSSYQVAQKMHAAIQRVSKQPVKYVINTGGQDHRWLGNGYFKQQGARIIAHKKAAADMAARGAEQIAGLKVEFKERIEGTVATLPDETFDTEKRSSSAARKSASSISTAATPRATAWCGCRKRACCFPATWCTWTACWA